MSCRSLTGSVSTAAFAHSSLQRFWFSVIMGRVLYPYGRANNNVRLNSATGYITPKDVLAGRQQQIHAERDRKLEAARQQRQSHRQQAA